MTVPLRRPVVLVVDVVLVGMVPASVVVVVWMLRFLQGMAFVRIHVYLCLEMMPASVVDRLVVFVVWVVYRLKSR